MLLVGILLSSTALAGDGFMVSSQFLKAVLESEQVQREAAGYFIESIKNLGDLTPHKFTYILKLGREEMAESDKFCLVIEGKRDPLWNVVIPDVAKQGIYSRLCNMMRE